MQRATSIVDATGVGLSHASHVRVIKAVAKIGTSYYPEIMKRVLIVNAPFAAVMVWRAVSVFLPEQTRKKVGIFGKGAFEKQLLEEIDASELPEQLGGTRTAKNAVPKAERVPPEMGDMLREAKAHS